MGATFIIVALLLAMTGCADSSYWRAPSHNFILECPGNDIRCKDQMEDFGFERLKHIEYLRTRPGSFWLVPPERLIVECEYRLEFRWFLVDHPISQRPCEALMTRHGFEHLDHDIGKRRHKAQRR